jgi:betaine lipid synthase
LGNGDKCNFEEINQFMGPEAYKYWEKRTHYFSADRSIYTRGGMGILVRLLKKFNWFFPNIDSQKQFKDSLLENKYLNFIWNSLKFFNIHYLCSWYLLGVPKKQLDLIPNIERYVSNVTKLFDHIDIQDNHYYYLVCNGKYRTNVCPDYLMQENYVKLHKNLENLNILYKSFYDALTEREYTKCVLMDHMDWLSHYEQEKLCIALYKHVTKTIILRSASEYPLYIDMLKSNGFIMTCVNSHSVNTVCDKINMYCSTWIGTKHA